MNWRSHRLQWLLAVTVMLLAGIALWHQAQTLSLAQLRVAWLAAPTPDLAWALAATALSFACLSGYERIATERVVPGQVPAALALRVGALAHALSNTLGFHALTGTAFRYQQYRRLGLPLTAVAKVLAVVALCVGTGVAMLSTLALVWLQPWAAGSPAAIALIVALLALLALAWRPLRRKRRDARVSWRWLAQLLPLATLEMATAVFALYVLLPSGSQPDIAAFALIFVAAMALGLISHAPGGIGVFEAAVLAALPTGDPAGVLVALLLYRLIYNLLPFALAVLVLGRQALRARRDLARASVGGRISAHHPLLVEMQPRQLEQADRSVAAAAILVADPEQ